MDEKPPTRVEKRLSNSELHLRRLAEEEEDSLRDRERGILEIFGEREREPDEDAPLTRDPSE